jgi:hypothetical protein
MGGTPVDAGYYYGDGSFWVEWRAERTRICPTDRAARTAESRQGTPPQDALHSRPAVAL